MKSVQTITLDLSALPLEQEPIYGKLLSIAKVRIEERSGARVVPVGGQLTVHFALSAALTPEAYTISDAPDGLLIQGNDFRALMYGLGRFLHASRYDDSGMHRRRYLPERRF